MSSGCSKPGGAALLAASQVYRQAFSQGSEGVPLAGVAREPTVTSISFQL